MQRKNITVNWNILPPSKTHLCETLYKYHNGIREQAIIDSIRQDNRLQEKYAGVQQKLAEQEIQREQPYYSNFQNTIESLFESAIYYRLVQSDFEKKNVITKIIERLKTLLRTLQNFKDFKKNGKIHETINDESNQIIAIILIFKEVFNDTIKYEVIKNCPQPQKNDFIGILSNVSDLIEELYNYSNMTDIDKINKYKSEHYLNKKTKESLYDTYNEYSRTIAPQKDVTLTTPKRRGRVMMSTKTAHGLWLATQ